MKILNLIVLVLFLAGCHMFEEKLAEPPPFYTCEATESLLICDSADLTECDGYLKDKPIIIEEIEL